MEGNLHWRCNHCDHIDLRMTDKARKIWRDLFSGPTTLNISSSDLVATQANLSTRFSVRNAIKSVPQPSPWIAWLNKERAKITKLSVLKNLEIGAGRFLVLSQGGTGRLARPCLAAPRLPTTAKGVETPGRVQPPKGFANWPGERIVRLARSCVWPSSNPCCVAIFEVGVEDGLKEELVVG